MFTVKQGGFTLIEIMIALGISSFICVIIFDCIESIEILQQRQLALVILQQKIRFLSLFFREKIQMAGDWSCEPDHQAPKSPVIYRYTTTEASEKLGVKIKANTDLLQLNECVRFNHEFQYLPINFFIADTHRVNKSGKKIDALFVQIQDHPREEWMTDVVNFRINLQSDAVDIGYVLSSIDSMVREKVPYWFSGKFVMPDDNALYRSGAIVVVRRNALA